MKLGPTSQLKLGPVLLLKLISVPDYAFTFLAILATVLAKVVI